MFVLATWPAAFCKPYCVSIFVSMVHKYGADIIALWQGVETGVWKKPGQSCMPGICGWQCPQTISMPCPGTVCFRERYSAVWSLHSTEQMGDTKEKRLSEVLCASLKKSQSDGGQARTLWGGIMLRMVFTFVLMLEVRKVGPGPQALQKTMVSFLRADIAPDGGCMSPRSEKNPRQCPVP